MADLLPEKSMISQKISSFLKKTFAGGTGSILGGIFFGILVWIPLWDSGWDSGNILTWIPPSHQLKIGCHQIKIGCHQLKIGFHQLNLQWRQFKI